MYTIGPLFIALAVSFDSFGAGISYGMRKIKVPFKSLFIIMLCSALMIFTSMAIGSALNMIISPVVAKTLGGSILILLGMWGLYNAIISKRVRENDDYSKKEAEEPKEKIWRFKIKKLGIFITILKKPQKADLDNSLTISVKEAFLLGFALSIDSFSAGIGASMLSYSPFVTAISVSIMSGAFVYFGLKLGHVLSSRMRMRYLNVFPPFILIALGIFNLL